MPELEPAQRIVSEIATAEDYKATFEAHRSGEKVLMDLQARFHDRQIWVPGALEGARETERRAAQQEVIGYILRKLGQIEEGKPDE